MRMSRHPKYELCELKKFMLNIDIPYNYYSIGDYLDEAVCIEFIGNKWIVYEGERGKKYNLKSYLSFSQVCDDFFSRISETEQQEQLLKLLWNMKNTRTLPGQKRRLAKRRYYTTVAIKTSNSPLNVSTYVEHADIPNSIVSDAVFFIYMIRKSRRIGKTRKQIGKTGTVPVPIRNNRSWQLGKKWNNRKCKKTI